MARAACGRDFGASSCSGKAVLCLVEPAAQLGLLRVRALHVRVFPQLLAQLLQLVCDLVRGAAGIVDDALRLGAGLRARPFRARA